MNAPFVSQREIARAAAVSVSAVSLALRNHPKVSPRVRARIQAIAKSMGYHADPKISTLMEHLRTARRQRPVSRLAVLVPELTPAQLESYHPIKEMLAGVNEFAREAGFELEVFHLIDPDMSPKRLRTILRTRGIQGIFVAPFARGIGRMEFDFSGFATATAGYSIVEPHLHRACPDYLQMMDKTLDAITRQGHRRVGLVLTYQPGGIGHKLFSSSFLYCQNQIPDADRIPILPKAQISDETLLRWIEQHQPEAIISSGSVYQQLVRLGVPIPRKIKFASIDLSESPHDAAGVDHGYRLVGHEAAKLIHSQFLLNLSGVPAHPKVVLVDSQWRTGFTLPDNASRRESRGRPCQQ
jgi:Transcriptional regulators